jgi:hypothetical protein
MLSHSQINGIILLPLNRFWHLLWKDSETFYIRRLWTSLPERDPSYISNAQNLQRSVKIASLFVRREKIVCKTRSEEIGDEDLSDDAISIRTSTIIGTEKAMRVGPTRSNDSFDIFFISPHLRISIMSYYASTMT